MSKAEYQYRDAVDGTFVTPQYAAAHPDTTIKERIDVPHVAGSSGEWIAHLVSYLRGEVDTLDLGDVEVPDRLAELLKGKG